MAAGNPAASAPTAPAITVKLIMKRRSSFNPSMTCCRTRISCSHLYVSVLYRVSADRAACSAACCAFCNEAVLCSISTYWRCTQRADASLVFWVSRGCVLLLLLVAVAFLAAAFFHLAQAFTGWVLGTGSS